AVASATRRVEPMSTTRTHKGTRTFHDVLGFTWRHWRRQPWLIAGVRAAMIGATIADGLMPFFAVRLVDSVGLIDAEREAARRAALAALAAILALGLAMIGLRHLTFRWIIRLTLRIMAAIAQEAFWRVQRFSTEWHANTFGGSVVRRITRGMWAVDLLNDTLLVAVLPSAVGLLGFSVLVRLRLPAMGLVVAAGSVVYLALSMTGTLLYVAPAARLSNQEDTRVGAALADAVTCNVVVKAFGAEAREDAALTRVLAKWSRRTQRTW